MNDVSVRDPLCRRALAEQAAAAQSATPVPSPCVNVCHIEPASGLCAGCLRTLDEIGAWSQLADDAKRRVWAALPGRTRA